MEKSVPGKGGKDQDTLFQALAKLADQQNTESTFETKVAEGKVALKDAAAVKEYYARLRQIQPGLVENAANLTPAAYFQEGLAQIMDLPIGAALMQDLVNDYPLPGVKPNAQQERRLAERLQTPLGVSTHEEWISFQTLVISGAFRLPEVMRVMNINPADMQGGYKLWRQSGNANRVINHLRPAISEVVGKK